MWHWTISNYLVCRLRAYRNFRKRPVSLAKRVWNMVRNDNTPDEKKFLGIDLSIKKYPNNYNIENNVDKKREQLRDHLNLVSYIVAFIELHRQGYRIIEYRYWTYMIKWLSNPDYYRIDEFGNKNIVKSSEYAQYCCKMAGRSFSCDSLEINYYKSGSIDFQEKEVSIDFSDFNNNCEYVQRVFRNIR
ncbi:hypothetical protein RclHR1_15970003 [Rhizophagus clarus]|uniref:Uncharacterized protein n=1 Tax=Rhizophagus clarus TaxID=94130 RepID=A0A2Z6QU21_9GLOM|nr:hypothetical protein RclHR1_15970003 [Rhizophagus clarus]